MYENPFINETTRYEPLSEMDLVFDIYNTINKRL